MGLPVEQPRPRLHTISEYLAYEAEAKEKHEYRDGQIIAMAGGTYDHGLDIELPLREVYAGVVFPPPPPELTA